MNRVDELEDNNKIPEVTKYNMDGSVITDQGATEKNRFTVNSDQFLIGPLNSKTPQFNSTISPNINLSLIN